MFPSGLATAEGAAKTAITAYCPRSECLYLVVISASYGAPARSRADSVVRHFGRSAPCPLLVLPRARRGFRTTVRKSFIQVVCAIDYKALSEAVLRAAFFLARRSHGRLTLLHVVEGFANDSFVAGMRAVRVVERWRALAAAERGRLRRLVPMEVLSDSRLEPIIASGDAHRGILRAASDAKVDLVVMGMVPRNLLKDVLVGSTSRVVLRRARCPVSCAGPDGHGSTRHLVRSEYFGVTGIRSRSRQSAFAERDITSSDSRERLL